MQIPAFYRSKALFVCISPFRSHWVPVFPAAVPGIPSNWSPVRPLWQTAFASSYHRELKCHLRLPNILILLYWTHVGLITSNFVPGNPGRADVVLCSLGSFTELQHVPVVSSYRRHLQGQRQPLHCHHGWPALPKGTESRNGELGRGSFHAA